MAIMFHSVGPRFGSLIEGKDTLYQNITRFENAKIWSEAAGQVVFVWIVEQQLMCRKQKTSAGAENNDQLVGKKDKET